MSYKILDTHTIYHNSGMAVLTVAIECNINGNWKAYQGIVTSGEDEATEALIQYVAGRGIKLSKRLACAYFPNLKPENCECQ